VIFPGIAYTFLPWSNAYPTVIIVPLLFFASTTKTPSESPLIILFLTGKWSLSGLLPNGYSVIIAPPLTIICLYNSTFSGGYTVSNPHPSTAIVFPPAPIAPLCEYVSIPLANPLTMHTPSFARSYANLYAFFKPYQVASLQPIIAIDFSLSN